MNVDYLILVCAGCMIALLVAVVIIIAVLTSATVNFNKLLHQSENRIGETNNMVCKLAEAANNMAAVSMQCHTTIANVTTEYTKQVDKLQECRDKLLAENEVLLRENAAMRNASCAPRTTINNN